MLNYGLSVFYPSMETPADCICQKFQKYCFPLVNNSHRKVAGVPPWWSGRSWCHEFARGPRTQSRAQGGTGIQVFDSSKVLKSDLSQQARNVKWLQNRPEATKCKAAEPELEWNLLLGRSQHLSRQKEMPPLNTSVKRGSGRLTSFMTSNLDAK